MRKNYRFNGLIFILVLFSNITIKAQVVSDFENLVLNSESYFDGSDLSGNHNNGIFTSVFSSGTADFINVFDTTWGAPGFWSKGFAYSNKTDSSTSGYGNLYSAKAASGVLGSSNYIVSNNNSVIKLKGIALNTIVKGFYVTNSTYAANSMRDGDSFAKKFGSSNDAAGNPDGTNGEDWFLLTIKGYNGGVLKSDSVNFYLADFRFSNNSQDYIVTNWEWVDLTSLGSIDSLYFKLTSSDVGSFGMNTPSFFCIDNFNQQNVNVKPNTELKEKLTFYPNPVKDVLNINSQNDIKQVYIIDVSGKIVKSISYALLKNIQIDLSGLNEGIYFTKIFTENRVDVLKINKL